MNDSRQPPEGDQARMGPTVTPPNPGNLGSVLNRNIEALHDRRRGEERAASMQERIAEAVTRFTVSTGTEVSAIVGM